MGKRRAHRGGEGEHGREIVDARASDARVGDGTGRTRRAAGDDEVVNVGIVRDGGACGRWVTRRGERGLESRLDVGSDHGETRGSGEVEPRHGGKGAIHGDGELARGGELRGGEVGRGATVEEGGERHVSVAHEEKRRGHLCLDGEAGEVDLRHFRFEARRTEVGGDARVGREGVGRTVRQSGVVREDHAIEGERVPARAEHSGEYVD